MGRSTDPRWRPATSAASPLDPVFQPTKADTGVPRWRATCPAVSTSVGGLVSRPAITSSTTANRWYITSDTDQPGHAGTGVASSEPSNPTTRPDKALTGVAVELGEIAAGGLML